eukprot:GHVN01063680.1.p1 GENE.GHVN01063680.1~~GHVN01063680.1.p1  ORF type:complete len:365 (+),score=38.50 GHVN01063680.1:138-1232(+)
MESIMMKLVICGLMLTTILPSVNAQSPKSASQVKLGEMGALMASSDGFVVEFNSTGYNHFAIRTPKPYTLIILYRASDRHCPELCDIYHKAFQRVATEFVHQGAHMGSETQLPIVFGSIKLDKNVEVSKMHALDQVPFLAALDSKSLKKGGQGRVVIEKNAFMTASKGDSSGIKAIMLNFINEKTGRHVEIKRGVALSATLLAFVTIVLIVIAIIGTYVVLLVRRYPIIVPVVALVALTLSTGGLVFSIQNNSPFFGMDRGGHFIMFAKGRAQYYGEGLMMAVATVVAGLCFNAITLLPQKMKQKGYTKSTVNGVVIILLAVAFGLCKFVWWGHQFKTGLVTGGMLPASSAHRGPLRHDRGNSF